MQPLEYTEDLLVVARIDADAVVPNRELDLVVPVDSGNMNPGRLRTTEHNRVRNQLAKELRQLGKIEQHGRQRIVGNLRATLPDGRIHH